MHDPTPALPVAVVGAGLAGLTAATRLARAGTPCLLLDAAGRPGGRARSQARSGAILNLGPHALYRHGIGLRTLTGLGVELSAHPPPDSGLWGSVGGRLEVLPGGLWTLLRTALLPLRAKGEFGKLLTGIGSIDASSLEGSAADWIAGRLRQPAARALVDALLRLSTYCPRPGALPARDAVAQLQLAVAGVLYLDGGWQSLIDSLRERFAEAGGELRTKCRVIGLERRTGGLRLLLQDGDSLQARAVVLAAGRQTAEQLLAPWEVRWPQARPLVASSLDLVLDALPRPRHRFVLGVDAPLYLSLHSSTARLAEPGLHVLHAMRYGEPEGDVRALLEDFVERAHPGWRDHVRLARFLPRLTVVEDLPDGGCAARVPVRPLDGMPVWLAGDGIGAEGMLAVAAIASGARAAEEIVELSRAEERHDRRSPARA